MVNTLPAYITRDQAVKVSEPTCSTDSPCARFDRSQTDPVAWYDHEACHYEQDAKRTEWTADEAESFHAWSIESGLHSDEPCGQFCDL